nr:MAG TPA: hypothetical protein [Caudoviricetes sp.]
MTACGNTKGLDKSNGGCDFNRSYCSKRSSFFIFPPYLFNSGLS